MTVRTRPNEEHLIYAPDRFDRPEPVPADPWVAAGGPERLTDEDAEAGE